MTSTTAAPPKNAPVLSHREIVTILIALMMGMFLSALDQTIVTTAMRAIADDLQGFDIQAWATTAFLITSTISTPLYGKLSDIYGRKPFFLFAIVVFIVGSALCGLASGMYELAAYRALQGIGAGGLMSLALSIIGDIVPPRERARYQGYFLAVFGISSVLGPVLGGFFAGAETILGVDGWRWIFYLNVPIALVAMGMIVKFLHIPHTRTDHRIDWPGAIALIVGVVPLLIVAEQGRDWGWTSGRSLLCYAVGVLGLIAFLLVERWYGDEALLPLRLFRGRTFAIGSGSSFILGIAMFGGFITIPLYLQVVRGATLTEGGLQLIPFVVGIMIGSIVAGQVISRTGRYRIFPIVGSALLLLGLVLFAFVGADTPLWQTMLIMVVVGLGLGGNMQPMILAVQNAASPREIGVSTSSVTFFRSMGGTLAAAAFLSVLFAQVEDRVVPAYQAAASDPAFQAAGAAHPDQVAQLRGLSSGTGGLSDTSFLNTLNPVLAHPFKVAFSEAMSIVFIIAALIMVIGLVLVFLLPELPLRHASAAQARLDEDNAALAASGAAATNGNRPANGARAAKPPATAKAGGGASANGKTRANGGKRPASRGNGKPGRPR